MYSDDILLYPPASLGDLTGRVLLEGVGARRGVLVWIDGLDNEPPATTDPDGNYLVTDLVPGPYGVRAGEKGWADLLFFSNALPNSVTSLPDLVLAALVFADGFED